MRHLPALLAVVAITAPLALMLIVGAVLDRSDALYERVRHLFDAHDE